MIVRAVTVLMAGCLCLAHGAADARGRSHRRPVAAADLSRLSLPSNRAEQMRQWREARWMGSDPGAYDDGGRAHGIRWRLRGAGVKVRVPIALAN